MQISQKDEQISQQKEQLSAAIKALSATNSAEQIAQILNIDIQQVKEILGN
jgi:DNA-directed RNA polymerase specialized sigma subunit